MADGRPTAELEAAVARILAEDVGAEPSDRRRALIARELDVDAPNLVATDARGWPEEDREFLRRMITVANAIDALFQRQLGIEGLHARIDPDDTASAAYLQVVQSPFCRLSRDPECRAIADTTLRVHVDPWPVTVQDSGADFCASIGTQSALRSPTTVVRATEGGFEAIAYTEAYADLSPTIAAAVRHAADALMHEPVVVDYLRAVATDLESGDWQAIAPAARAMTASSARWFVDLGVDGRTSWDPCRTKWSYHLTLGRFEPETAALSRAMNRSELGRAVAALAGTTYDESLVPPLDIALVQQVLTAGEDRYQPVDGMTWEGRSVVYPRPVSQIEAAQLGARRSAILDAASVLLATPARERAYQTLVLLHETCHALWPGLERTGSPPSAARLGLVNELFADSTALYLATWLSSRGVIDGALLTAIREESVNWNAQHGARQRPSQHGLQSAAI